MTAPAPGDTLQWMPAWSRGQGEVEARDIFTRAYGSEPEGVWSAPGRVLIIGEHLDYNAGRTLSTATPHRLYLAARTRGDRRIRAVEGQSDELTGPDGVWEADLDNLGAARPHGWPIYIAAALWALQERGYDGPGLDIAATSCLPVGGGLSGWAALEAATALAADALWGLALASTEVGRTELAQACLEAEQEFIGSPFGGTDQHTSLRCRAGEAISLDFARPTPAAERFALPFREYGLGLLVVRSSDTYPLADPIFLRRQRECVAAARELGVRSVGHITSDPDAGARIARLQDPTLRKRATHIVSEIGRVAAVEQELAGTGPAHDRFTAIGLDLYRSHASLETLFEVSTPALDRAVDAAYGAGALGARMFGAGRGGSCLALVRRVEAERTAARIHDELMRAGERQPSFTLV